MKNIHWVIWLSVWLTVVLSVASSSAKPGVDTKSSSGSGASFDGIELEVRNDPIGRLTWLISPRGSKIISPIAAMITAPPIGHLIVFNPESKKYFESTNLKAVKHAMENYQSVINQKKFRWTPWKKMGEDTLSGIKCQHYKRSLLSPPEDKGRGLTSTFVDEAWVSPIDVRKNVQDYLVPLAQIFSWDMPFDRVDLKRISVWNQYQNGKLLKSDPKQEAILLSVKKRKFTAEEFALPKGYKACHQLADVMPDDMSFGFPH